MPRMTINARIDGLIARMDRIGNRLDRASTTEVATAAYAINADAKRRAPVKTGELRDSIGVRFEDGGRTAIIGTSVSYARFQKPFLQPAYRVERKKLLDRLSARLDEAVG